MIIIHECEHNFIDENILLKEPEKINYLFVNIYIDKILKNIISQDELNHFNAMDYTIQIKKNI